MSETSIVPIIVALIGSITTIAIRLIEIRSRKKETSEDKTTSVKRNRKNSIIRMVYVLGIIMIFGGAASFIKIVAFPVKPEISMTYPVSNDTIEQTVRVEGLFKNIPKNEKIWIFIKPLEINRYYPQNAFAEIDAKGNWSSVVYLGQENDNGEKFEIITTLVDDQAIRQINAYLKEAMNKQDWAGMKNITDNSIVYERRLVIRK